MEKKYLPIGSVVRLKDGNKRLMITGFLQYEDNEEGEKTIWDYCGCLYPEGVIASTDNYLFNHSQIEEINYLGLVNDEEKEFKEKLSQALEEYNNQNN